MGSGSFGGRGGPLQKESEGEGFAAFGTAAGQDLAAVAGGHSFTEAMDLAALALLGLVGSQHFFPSFLR